MSQYIHICEGKEDNSLCLFWRSRSFFYELDDYMPWTEEASPLTAADLKQIISSYKTEVLERDKEQLSKLKAKLENLAKLGIATPEVVDDIYSSIEYYDEEIGFEEALLNELRYVHSIMNDNKDRQFYYTNC